MAVCEKKHIKHDGINIPLLTLRRWKRILKSKKNLFNFYQLQCISTPIVILLVINFDLKLWAGNNKNSLKKTSFHGYWFTFKKDGYSSCFCERSYSKKLNYLLAEVGFVSMGRI